MKRIAQLTKELEAETDRRRRAQIAERIGTMMLREARPKPLPRVVRKPEPLPKSGWVPLGDLRRVLQSRRTATRRPRAWKIIEGRLTCRMKTKTVSLNCS